MWNTWNSFLHSKASTQRIALWDELVMSLEDHWGVPYCEIGAWIRWKLIKKNCAQTNDFLCYSVIAGSSLKAHSWLKRWSDLNASDIKKFVAYLIVMGLVIKPNMAKYWSTNSLTRTPFFGKILSRNTFQNILMNLHIADNNTDYPCDNPNHDPLTKWGPSSKFVKEHFN